MPGYPRQHLRADLVSIMKRKDVVRTPNHSEDAVRATLANDAPSNLLKSCKNTAGTRCRPRRHAAENI